MLDDVMQVQWEVEVYCARVTCGLCLAAGLCPFLSLFQSLYWERELFSEPVVSAVILARSG